MIDYEKVLLDLVTPMVEDKASVSVKKMDTLDENEILKASVANANFVDTVTHSLAEAYVFYHDMIPFTIYEDDPMIGFVSMYVGDKTIRLSIA